MALLDTGSEVTTITEQWVHRHVQDLHIIRISPSYDLERDLQNRGAILMNDAGGFWGFCPVFEWSSTRFDAGTIMHRRHMLLVIGMHVLGQGFGDTSNLPPTVQEAAQEVCLDKTVSKKGLARVTVNTMYQHFWWLLSEWPVYCTIALCSLPSVLSCYWDPSTDSHLIRGTAHKPLYAGSRLDKQQ